MLIFWNMAGVPLSYCHCTIYLANHAPSTYAWPKPVLVVLFASYLFMYWIWDTTNSQKNHFRQMERGRYSQRKSFPQLPWQTIHNPKKIQTETGDSILVDGWCTWHNRFPSSLPSSEHDLTSGRCLRSQDPLHVRPLLCPDLGAGHRLR